MRYTSLFLKLRHQLYIHRPAPVTAHCRNTCHTANMAASSSAPLLTQIVASSVCISHKSGKIIRDIMAKGDLGIIEKTGIKDLQTEADRSVQKCILASLHKMFPKVSVFGEEDDLNPREQINPDWIVTDQDPDVLEKGANLPDNLKNVKPEDIVIWVDPLDGTAEYTEGLLDHVTVLIGIAVNGQAECGVIYQPYYNYKTEGAKLGRVIWGIKGVGAYGLTKNDPGEGNIITTTRSHSCGTVVEAVDACEPTSVLKVGGAGHKVLLIIEGIAHAYVFASPGCKKWDTCAPEAVLHAIGGKLTDIHGNYIQYHHNVQRRNTGGVLAVLNKDQHDWYLDRIPDAVKEALPAKI